MAWEASGCCERAFFKLVERVDESELEWGELEGWVECADEAQE